VIEMGEDYKFDRFDIFEINDGKFIVQYEDGGVSNDTVDARILEYEDPDRILLNGCNPNLGNVKVLDQETAENPEKALEYLEDNYSPDSDDEALEELISF
jgi:hypothetical protein